MSARRANSAKAKITAPLKVTCGSACFQFRAKLVASPHILIS